MTTASIAELKANPSRYIRLAEQGEPVLVTAHRRPVARLMRIETAEATAVAIIPPARISAKRGAAAPTPRLPKRVDAVGVLLEERRRR